MTLTEALALTTGETITSRSITFRLTSVQPARPELDYAPSIFGKAVGPNGELQHHHTVCIILDGGSECMKALSYWTK